MEACFFRRSRLSSTPHSETELEASHPIKGRLGVWTSAARRRRPPASRIRTEEATVARTAVILHVVLYRPRPQVTHDQLQSFALELQRLFQAVPAIRRAVVGKRTDFDAGYQRSLGDTTYNYLAVLEFENEAGLIEYLTHPGHRLIGKLFWELCESTTVFEARGSDIRFGIPDYLG